jgi:hypothetical protein
MPNHPTQTGKLPAEPDLGSTALKRLRLGSNPFTVQVAAVGTADECVQSGVPEFATNQFSELLEIIGSYREGRPATRAYPVLGERGSGKTHLLYTLRGELQRRALQSGDETMVVVVDRLSAGMDPIGYLLWQIVNHLLAHKGDGERMLGVIASRLTARLLAEALRHLAPHQRVGLIPPKGFWDRLRLKMGSSARVRARLDGIEAVIQTCDRKNPTPEELRQACQAARLPLATAAGVVEQHLERVESKDVLGWFRKELYARLASLALLGNREPFEELHAGDYEDAPANVKKAGNLSRRLLETWIELLTTLNVPVVVVFDQLEDYLRSADPEQEKVNWRYFTGATAQFINELKHVCILIFAEKTFWTDLLNRAEPFAAERLRQPIPLPGRPAKPYLEMPDQVMPDVLLRLIQRRIRTGFPDLILTGLSPSFPFEENDLKDLKDETSIRGCLRRLAKRYDQIVYPAVRPRPDLRQKLADLWKESIAAAEKTHGWEMTFRVAFIPEVQNAIQGWLECLERNGLTGSGPWQKVEMLTEPEKQPYGNLSVIRTEGPHAPGVGIAAWLGAGKARPFDLKQRLGFFDANPCPIQTLVMLRADGEEALRGESKAVYDKAIKAGRDLRIHQYEPRHLHALMAFLGWHQAAVAETESAKETDPDAEKSFRQFLADLSKELLGWIDAWRQPVAVGKGAPV